MQHKTIDIPKEHIAHVLNVIISECLLGFERRLENGKHEWRGKRLDGTISDWSTDLPPFATDLAEAMHLATQVCRQMGVGLNAIYNPVHDVHLVVVLAIAPDGKSARPAFQVSGRPLPELLASAICQLIEADLMIYHRELFPAHYILSN